MRVLVSAAIFMLFLALGALEIYAARHVVDADASGASPVWYAH